MNEDFGLNWYAYGFRMYDAAIGRFPSVDPIADQFAFVSPFNYAENSPIRNIDLHGLQKFDTQQDIALSIAGKINFSATQKVGPIENWIGTKAASGAHYNSSLAQKLINHYGSGDGSPISLSREEMISVNVLNPQDVDVRAVPGFDSKLENGEIGGTFEVDHFFTVQAGTAGTLGDHFEIMLNGSVTKTKSGFSFSGEMSYSDIFDFNLNAPETNNQRDGLVRMGNALMPNGTPFNIESAIIPVIQNQDSDVMDFFNGLPRERIPSILGDEVKGAAQISNWIW